MSEPRDTYKYHLLLERENREALLVSGLEILGVTLAGDVGWLEEMVAPAHR